MVTRVPTFQEPPRISAILIITTAEIESLTCTADLTELVNRRYLRAIMSGGLGIPAPSHRS